MTPPVLTELERSEQVISSSPNAWPSRARLLWNYRRFLSRATAVSLVIGLVIAFTIPKQYKSSASIMPPDQGGSGAMMLAALASHSSGLGGLGALASGLLGGHTTTALYINLLRSGTVSGHLIDRFHLQTIYHKRYRVDTAKFLAHHTDITDDKKSGVITIEVKDTDPVRARDLTLGYLDELNKLVTQTNTSSAHRERIFVEQRLHSVQNDLEQAQLALSAFSSKNNAIDIKEQTRAMVDAGARIEGELVVAESGLQSLRQIYGDENIRVRETEARIGQLKSQIGKMVGTAPDPDQSSNASAGVSGNKDDLYPPLRQIPGLAVPYTDLYRRVRVQETVFELLTQQYELARINEARDIPVVSVIDEPGIAEKKSFPPRLILALAFTAFSFATMSAAIIARERWRLLDVLDPRKTLVTEIFFTFRHKVERMLPAARRHE